MANAQKPKNWFYNANSKRWEIRGKTAGNPLAYVDEAGFGVPFGKSILFPKNIKVVTASTYLTSADAGVIDVAAVHIYVYLPAQAGNAGVHFEIKVTTAYSVSGINSFVGTRDGGSLIEGSALLKSTAQYDLLSVVCDGAEWLILNKIGTWS